MAGRAKENLPGGSLKYLFVYLKIRIFKCSYFWPIEIHAPMDFSLPFRVLAGGQFIDVAALEFTPSTDVNESLTMAYKDDRWITVPLWVASSSLSSLMKKNKSQNKGFGICGLVNMDCKHHGLPY